MSNMTDSINQANMYAGFYPSKNGDRKYESSDFGRFLDGLVTDGIFTTLLDQFKVKPNTGNTVTVCTGKAWFNHTWLELTEEYAITLKNASASGDRYDAVVIAINNTDSNFTYGNITIPARDTIITVIEGNTVTSNPVLPIANPEKTILDEQGVYAYPIANIRRAANSDVITLSDIDIVVGTSVTPFVTALVEPSKDATFFTEKWRSQLDNFINDLYSDWEEEKAKYNTDWETYSTDKETEMNTWIAAQQKVYEDWKNSVLGDSKEEVVTQLTNSSYEHEIKSYLLNGLPDGTKTFNETSTIITSTNDKYILIKEFNEDFSVCTTVLKLKDSNTELARSETVFSDNGNIETNMTLTINS